MSSGLFLYYLLLPNRCHRRRTGKASFISKGQHNDLFELSPTNGGTVLRALDQPPEHDLGATNGVSSGTSFAPLQNEKDVEDEEEEDPKKKLMEEDQAHLEAEKGVFISTAHYPMH